jgi:NADPH:quinone reductase-like Zn-dependent oxidoreductase
VTAIDSTAKLDMLRSIGADYVIDYTREDFTESGEIYDVIFDVVGTISFSRSNKSIKQDGTYLLANPIRGQVLRGPWTRMTSSKKVVMQTASGSIEDLIFLRELIEAGKIKTVIDRSYPLEQIVEAHRYVEAGGKKGNVVITVGHSD